MNIDKRIETIVKAADDKKAFDISVLDLNGLSSVADYFVILSAGSSRQAISISENIEDEMSKGEYEPLNKEGYNTGSWVLLDYGDILVHVFNKDEREFYDLERLWIDAKNIYIDELLD